MRSAQGRTNQGKESTRESRNAMPVSIQSRNGADDGERQFLGSYDEQ
jgi:hypothetical protein